MATETTVRLVDDLDGSVADRTVYFTWEGASYEIDLNKKNASTFEKAIKPYVSSARKVGSARKPARTARAATKTAAKRATSTTATTATRRAEIRTWAQQAGYSIGDRGRISQEIIDAFEAAKA